jgi:predicted RNA-binding protein YlqC (UPF0109 family)
MYQYGTVVMVIVAKKKTGKLIGFGGRGARAAN